MGLISRVSSRTYRFHTSKMLRISKIPFDKAQRLEKIGKFAQKASQNAPSNRNFKHNKDLKHQKALQDAYMQDLDKTHSKVYSNPRATFEYLRLKVIRPASF